MKSEIKQITIFSVTLFVTLIFSFSAHSQDDTTKNEYQKEFDDFLNNIQQEFKTFKSKNDSVFYQFLQENWKEFELFKDQRKAVPKPKIQPRVDTTRTRIKYQEIKPLDKRKT
ncbi:MAG: hypothetical protein GXO86_04170, partial [Chlorobi bacterium]|nr:hypothetical protein [Chlorobiota bacterium]